VSFGATGSEKCERSCDWLKYGKECGSGLSSRWWGRERCVTSPNNSCEGDYISLGSDVSQIYALNLNSTFEMQLVDLSEPGDICIKFACKA